MLKRELRLLEKSKIEAATKNLILQFMNYRLANGLSIAKVHKELKSLRLICERCDLDLKN